MRLVFNGDLDSRWNQHLGGTIALGFLSSFFYRCRNSESTRRTLPTNKEKNGDLFSFGRGENILDVGGLPIEFQHVGSRDFDMDFFWLKMDTAILSLHLLLQ